MLLFIRLMILKHAPQPPRPIEKGLHVIITVINSQRVLLRNNTFNVNKSYFNPHFAITCEWHEIQADLSIETSVFNQQLRTDTLKELL